MSSSECQYLYIIGAYRDNEVSLVHPLILMLEEIRKTSVRVNQIHLDPLNYDCVEQLVAETLHRSAEDVMSLAELVLVKTQGNPFFINQFLRSLYKEQLLSFDHNQGSWHWNLEQIQAQDITDNVVEFMALKIQKLETNTQEILKQAACIGNEFNLQTLA